MQMVADYAQTWLWSLGGFVLLWVASLVRRDASLVDFWWGPGFGVMALVAWVGAGMPVHAHALLLLGLVLLWSLRLGVQLGLRRIAEGQEDPRYAELRARFAPGFWWKSLLVVFLLQAVLQGLIGAAPVMALAAEARPVGLLAVLGSLLALAGIAIETRADTELDRFRRAHRGAHGLLTTGLRAHVRYPQYLGEMMAWAGIAAVAVSAGIWFAPASAIIVVLLLWKVSGIPVLEDRLARTRPAYAHYRAAVPALIPKREVLPVGAGRDPSGVS